MFQLTNGEYEILKSQIVTSNVLISQNATSNTSDNQKDAILKSQNATSSWGGTRKAPYAFTENGVAMLSVVAEDKYHCHSWIDGQVRQTDIFLQFLCSLKNIYYFCSQYTKTIS